MEEVLNRILSEIQGLRHDIRKVEQHVQRVDLNVQSVEQDVQRIDQNVQSLEQHVQRVEHDVRRVEQKLDDFRESQEITNKLLAGEAAGIKSQLRDFRRDVREWQLLTSRRIDRLEEKLSDMRGALQ